MSPGQGDNGKYTFYFFQTTSSFKYLQQINVVVYGGKVAAITTYLSAEISSISRTGEALIKFSSLIRNYENVSGLINTTVLQVVAGPKGLSSSQTQVTGKPLNMTWKAVDYP